jgi:hypothetical protein
MRKRIVDLTPPTAPFERQWLDLECIVSVELTSEDHAFPIESALQKLGQGWRASEPGVQRIRLIFDHPVTLRRIWLEFEEAEIKRTQEFTLRWSPDRGRSFREIVRQQWNFSPPGTAREIEDYVVELPDVTLLDLTIVPDIGNGNARASLLRMRLA